MNLNQNKSQRIQSLLISICSNLIYFAIVGSIENATGGLNLFLILQLHISIIINSKSIFSLLNFNRLLSAAISEGETT